MKRLPLALAALAAGLVIAAPAAHKASAAPTTPLEIYFVDVEGGAATLVALPGGESLLIDSGWPGLEGRDARRIQAAAQAAGLKQIDHYFTTHWHMDHYGAIPELAKLMPVRNYYHHGIPAVTLDDPENFPTMIAAYKEASKGRSKTLNPGDKFPLRVAGVPLELTVLAARGKVIGEGSKAFPMSCTKHPGRPIDTGENAQSLAFRLKYGKFSFLDCGDLTWNIEHKLVCPTNRIGHIDLLQVTHHGANLSSNPALISAIAPTVAVIDNGPRKGGDKETYATLKGTKSIQAIYQLHKNLATGPADNAPDNHIANLDEKCEGHYIRARVSPDGTSYTLSIGPDKMLGTFKVK